MNDFIIIAIVIVGMALLVIAATKWLIHTWPYEEDEDNSIAIAEIEANRAAIKEELADWRRNRTMMCDKIVADIEHEYAERKIKFNLGLITAEEYYEIKED